MKQHFGKLKWLRKMKNVDFVGFWNTAYGRNLWLNFVVDNFAYSAHLWPKAWEAKKRSTGTLSSIAQLYAHHSHFRRRILCLQAFNLIQTGLFLVLCDRGGRIPPPPLNSENIKAMTTKLKGQIIRPKMFPLKSTTSAGDVIWRHNNVLFSNGGPLGSKFLDFFSFP